MSIPFFYPPVTYIRALTLRRPIRLRALCQLAGVKCKASGAWTNRQVEVTTGDALRILAQPGDWSKIRIEIPRSMKNRARVALAALAYGAQDLVAKESIRGSSWARIRPRRGRPVTGKAISNRERQRIFRARKAREIR